MKNPFISNQGAFFSNVGKGLGYALGLKFFLWDLIFGITGFILSIGSVGMKLIFRKKQGVSILGFAWINLFLHIGLVIIILSFFLGFFGIENVNFNSKMFSTLLNPKNLFVFYWGIILLAIIFHLFNDFESSRTEGMEQDPYYTGKGIFNFLAKGEYKKELYTNLLDPIIAFGIGYFISNIQNGEALGLVIKFGAICFFVESIFYLAIDWHIRQSSLSAKAKATEYANLNKETKNDTSKGRRPK